MTNEVRYQARRAELRGDWREAHRLWLMAGELSNAEVCKLILDATARGDKFRSLVADKLQTAGLPQDLPACPALDRILREATKEMVV